MDRVDHKSKRGDRRELTFGRQDARATRRPNNRYTSTLDSRGVHISVGNILRHSRLISDQALLAKVVGLPWTPGLTLASGIH